MHMSNLSLSFLSLDIQKGVGKGIFSGLAIHQQELISVVVGLLHYTS